MADNRNEQELQALFRKHLPMKQMSPDFANQLKQQVLAEVAATLKPQPVASVTTEDTTVNPSVHIQERMALPKPPRSLAKRPAINWFEWLRDHLRFTPSLALAGAMVLLIGIIILRTSDLLLSPPTPNAPITLGQPDVTPTPTTEDGEVASTEKTVAAVALVVTETATVTPDGTETPEPTTALDGEASPTPVDEDITPSTLYATPLPVGEETKAGSNSGGVAPSPEPTDTVMPSNGGDVPEGRESTPTLTTTLTPPANNIPNSTAGGSNPTPTTSSTNGAATATPTLEGEKRVATVTATAEGIRWSTNTPTNTPTSDPLTVADVILTLTATQVTESIPGILSTLTPFVPVDTPIPSPTKTLSPTPTSTYGIFPRKTPTATNTPTATPTLTASVTSTATSTETDVPVVLATDTDTPVPTATNTLMPTNTPLPTATPTVTATDTPLPTATMTATDTPLPTVTPTATNTPLPTATATATDTPLPTATPTATNTSVPSEPIKLSATIGQYFDHTLLVTPVSPSQILQVVMLAEPPLSTWLQFQDLGNGQVRLQGTPLGVGIYEVRLQLHDEPNDPNPIIQVIEITVVSPVGGGIFTPPGSLDTGAAQDVTAAVSESVSITETQPISPTNIGN